jgi:hypothetical protein
MAKAKGKDIVGWSGGNHSSSIQTIAEWDVNQTKNRKRGMAPTWSKGSIVRQIGLARMPVLGGGDTYFLYSHSQVSNAQGYNPAAWVGLNRDDLEKLFGTIGKVLFGEPEA